MAPLTVDQLIGQLRAAIGAEPSPAAELVELLAKAVEALQARVAALE